MRRSLELAGRSRQLRVVALLLVMVAILVSACDSGTPAPPSGSNAVLPTEIPPTAEPYTKVNEVGIILKDFSILPDNLGLPAGKIRFTVTNQGTLGHDLVISNDTGVIAKTPVFTQADGPKTLDVTLQPGTYKIACDVPGHADKGMTGTLTIK